jgi:hypothetical protein
MVNSILIHKSAPHPLSRKTPTGGRKMAKMIFKISEAVKGILLVLCGLMRSWCSDEAWRQFGDGLCREVANLGSLSVKGDRMQVRSYGRVFIIKYSFGSLSLCFVTSFAPIFATSSMYPSKIKVPVVTHATFHESKGRHHCTACQV